jgi:hypothetical protein
MTMGTASETAVRRKELKTLAARVPRLRGRSGHLITNLLSPHFAAEDCLIAADRALARADGAAQGIHAQLMYAASESQTGSATHRREWIQAFERLAPEAEDARVALERARNERDRASAMYCGTRADLYSAVDRLL